MTQGLGTRKCVVVQQGPCHENEPIRDQAGTLYISQLHLCLHGAHLEFHALHFPSQSSNPGRVVWLEQAW